MTQNVFGNDSRRKLDFKIGVVGEAFNQVRVNGLPAKFQLFNQEGCRYLRTDIDNKSSMDLMVYFLVFP